MPRPKNSVQTVQVTVAITERIRDDLESLTRTGYFGKNVAETTSILLGQVLNKMREKHKIKDLPLQNQK